MRFHTSREATPGARGAALGRVHGDGVRHTVRAYHALFGELAGLTVADVRRFGAEAAGRLRTSHPHLAEEIDAIARASGVAADELTAVNCRTELLAGHAAAECTFAALLPPATGGPALMAQNWDWYPVTRESMLVWTVHRGESWHCTLTEAGVLAKIGINSDGVGCCLNYLASTADGTGAGLPVHLVCHEILASATTWSQAAAIAHGSAPSASSCLNVGSAEGVASVELSPRRVRTVRPGGRPAHLVHTNHFLREPVGDDMAIGPDGWPSTLRRLRRAGELLEGHAGAGAGGLRAMLADHEDHPDSICKHAGPGDPVVTLAGVLLDLVERRMWVADGNPCRTPFGRVA